MNIHYVMLLTIQRAVEGLAIPPQLKTQQLLRCIFPEILADYFDVIDIQENMRRAALRRRPPGRVRPRSGLSGEPPRRFPLRSGRPRTQRPRRSCGAGIAARRRPLPRAGAEYTILTLAAD